MVLVAVLYAVIFVAATVVNAQATADTLTSAKGWILSQRISTDGSPTLIDSYENGNDVAYTYDQAIATIALVIMGEHRNAALVLKELQTLQMASGSWYNAYYGNSLYVQEALQHAGPVLWVVLAAKYYEDATGDTTFHAMAETALQWTLTLQQDDGGINGGLDWDGTTILPWASTEHNIDLYAALVAFGHATEASSVQHFIHNSTWDNAIGRFWGGRNDPCNPLDTNVWGYMALGNRYRRGLHFVEETMNYVSTTLDPIANIHGYDFSGPYPAECAERWCWCWTPVEDIWFEGTAQMAAALRVAHQPTKADELLRNIEKAQALNGGIPYSLKGSYNGLWSMDSYHSVAATGWYIIAKAGVNPLQF